MSTEGPKPGNGGKGGRGGGGGRGKSGPVSREVMVSKKIRCVVLLSFPLLYLRWYWLLGFGRGGLSERV